LDENIQLRGITESEQGGVEAVVEELDGPGDGLKVA
jgi:hypothetical protein